MAILLSLATGCAREDQLGDQAKAVEPAQGTALDKAYSDLLRAEQCARRATDQQAVALQLFRVSRIAARAQAGGLGQQLIDTRAKWDRFAERAEWTCDRGDPLAGLARSVDAFDRTVTQALARG